MTDDRLTDDDLAAIAARAEKATPGPWKEEWESDAIYEDGPLTFWPYQIVTETLVVCGFDDSQPTPDDFTFIAAARADIPALLAHIRAQDAELARLRDALKAVAALGELPYVPQDGCTADGRIEAANIARRALDGEGGA